MRLCLLLGLLSLSTGCIKPKIYRFEKTARILAEEREKVLMKELADRKSETAALIQQSGQLNRVVGAQELKITEMTSEISGLTKVQTESSAQLRAEKTALEKELANKNEVLARRESALQNIRQELQQRTDSLNRMHATLTRLYEMRADTHISVVIERDLLLVTYADKSLFANDGVALSETGRHTLVPLAAFLSQCPTLDAEVLAYTDNVLPAKNKTLKDTWEWSLARATQLVRTLVRDYNVNANQLTPVGKGEFYPLASNETNEGREKNRRTVVVIHAFTPFFPNKE